LTYFDVQKFVVSACFMLRWTQNDHEPDGKKLFALPGCFSTTARNCIAEGAHANYFFWKGKRYFKAVYWWRRLIKS